MGRFHTLPFSSYLLWGNEVNDMIIHITKEILCCIGCNLKVKKISLFVKHVN